MSDVMTVEMRTVRGVKQTILGRGPDFNEPAGNCMQAALATVLGLPLEAVPHFLVGDNWASRWWDDMNAWLLAEHQQQLLALEPGCYFNTGFLNVGGTTYRLVSSLHLMVGVTVRGSRHVVVGFAGEFLFDPHPSDAGLLKADTFEVFVRRPEGAN